MLLSLSVWSVPRLRQTYHSRAFSKRSLISLSPLWGGVGHHPLSFPLVWVLKAGLSLNPRVENFIAQKKKKGFKPQNFINLLRLNSADCVMMHVLLVKLYDQDPLTIDLRLKKIYVLCSLSSINVILAHVENGAVETQTFSKVSVRE